MNWLVDEPGYNTKSKVNNIHFTKGGQCGLKSMQIVLIQKHEPVS